MTSLLKKFARKTTGSVCKHKKLSEDWGNVREPVIEGVPFYVKYLGSTLVHKASGEESTADAIKTIVAMARSKKLPHVKLTISLRGIHMLDLLTEDTRLEVSIYRVSYCSADATYDRVFAFIATNKNETLECHAFLCPKRKMAQSATLTIAQAFNLAFELWQASQERKRRRRQLKTGTQMSPPPCCRPACCTSTNCSTANEVEHPSANPPPPSSSIVSCSSGSSCCSISNCSYVKSCVPIKEEPKPSVSNSSSSSSGYNSSHETPRVSGSQPEPCSFPAPPDPLVTQETPSEGGGCFPEGVDSAVPLQTRGQGNWNTPHRIVQTGDHLLIDLTVEHSATDPWKPSSPLKHDKVLNGRAWSSSVQGQKKTVDRMLTADKTGPLDADGQQHERGNWVHFDPEESELMNFSFTEIAHRPDPHPLMRALPANAQHMALDAFVSPSHQLRPTVSESPLKHSQLSTPVKTVSSSQGEVFASPVPVRRNFTPSPKNVSLNGSQSAANTPVMARRHHPTAIPARLTGNVSSPALVDNKWSPQSTVNLSTTPHFHSNVAMNGSSVIQLVDLLA